MNTSGKVATGITVLVVGGLVALAVPTVSAAYAEVSSWAVFQPSGELTEEQATADPSPEPGSDEDDATAEKMLDELGDGYIYVGNGTAIPKGNPAGCESPRWIHLGARNASLSGDLTDRGARDLAAGTTGLDAEGRIVTYTVAAGDALYAIGERFCIANAMTIAHLNHTQTIQPGEVLLLHPDTSVPWVPYITPAGAPDGYQQLPYQAAVEAMSAAAAAGDLDAMRQIFADELSGLFPDPADADMIARALDSGDLQVLRQMFA